jgi:hypothetical protein
MRRDTTEKYMTLFWSLEWLDEVEVAEASVTRLAFTFSLELGEKSLISSGQMRSFRMKHISGFYRKEV